MSTTRSKQKVTWNAENSEGMESDEDAPTKLGELQKEILRAAGVLQQVRHEVTQLQRENESLRQKLLPAPGPTTSSTHVLPYYADSKEGSACEKQALQPSAGPQDSLTYILPYCPDSTEATVGEKQVFQSATGPAAGLTHVLPQRPDSSEAPLLQSSAGVKPSYRLDGSLAAGVAGSIDTFVNVMPFSVPDGTPVKTERLTKASNGEDDSMHKTKTSIKRHANEIMKKNFPKKGPSENEQRLKGRTQRLSSVYERDMALRSMLFDPEMMKQKMKSNIIKPDFNIMKFYYKKGIAQKIARSSSFEHVKLAAILLNTIWIAVDTEHNKADVLIDAHVGFQICEHLFCLYFLIELLIRFAAFEKKWDCLQSRWFIFDAFLVVAMVFEDWIMTIVLLASAGNDGGADVGMIKNAAILRILRLLRLARLGRALRLIRQSPEVMIMVKALAASTRCVLWTCVLLGCMIFFFAVTFTQLCKETPLDQDYFPSLSGSLHTLMIAGLFPDLGNQSQAIKNEHIFYWLVWVLYLMMTTLTVMNLLIGVLVEVAQSSAKVERDAMDVAYVKEVFIATLDLGDVADFQAIFVCKEEFAALLEESDILRAMTKVGIDVFGLIDLMDFIFIRGAVGFVELLEVVLNLRSSADVTVRDIVEVRKFLTYELSKMKQELSSLIGVFDSESKVWSSDKGKRLSLGSSRPAGPLAEMMEAPVIHHPSLPKPGNNFLKVVDV